MAKLDSCSDRSDTVDGLLKVDIPDVSDLVLYSSDVSVALLGIWLSTKKIITMQALFDFPTLFVWHIFWN